MLNKLLNQQFETVFARITISESIIDIITTQQLFFNIKTIYLLFSYEIVIYESII